MSGRIAFARPQALHSPFNGTRLMSTGVILTVLSNIPWGHVVENAPKVADGAAKLWSTVSGFRKPKGSSHPTHDPLSTQATGSGADALQSRLRTVEEEVVQLQEQMQASSALIKALAEQNTQLVNRIELNRVRLKRASIAAASLGFALLVAVGYLMLRP